MKIFGKIVVALGIFLVGVGVGFFACFYTNGYERSLFASDATRTDLGTRVIETFERHMQTSNGQPLSAAQVLGFVPQKVCIQPPYIAPSAFRQHIKANLLGSRMADDTENLLWIVDASSSARYISVNRMSAADIVRPKDGSMCIDGDRAIFQPSYFAQQLVLNFEEKK
jgi:hypothetical protein